MVSLPSRPVSGIARDHEIAGDDATPADLPGQIFAGTGGVNATSVKLHSERRPALRHPL